MLRCWKCNLQIPLQLSLVDWWVLSVSQGVLTYSRRGCLRLFCRPQSLGRAAAEVPIALFLLAVLTADCCRSPSMACGLC